jgi:hypothetical protein
MVESRVDDAIRLGHSAAQAFQVFDDASMHLSTSGDQRLRARVRASHAEHLMACVN